MKREALDCLRCPYCCGALRVAHILSESNQGIDYGLLECPGCRFNYPIVAGVILVFGPHEHVDLKAETDATTVLHGPSVTELVDTLKAGNSARALALLLGPSGNEGRLFPALPAARLETAGGPLLTDWHGELKTPKPFRLPRGERFVRPLREAYRRAALPAARERIARYLIANEHALSALDAIHIYYGAYSAVENVNYFAFRFGQPRYLASLSLAALLRRSDGPILDLACGMGHLTHYLTHALAGRTVFALDRDFFRLYVARRYVAPEAIYVCAAADQELPFPPGFFGGIICSDAFHYFLHRAAAVRELLRLLTAEGVLLLSRFGNRDVEPHEGYELQPDGYRRLLADTPHGLRGEEGLLGDYLERHSPDLTARLPGSFQNEKWLSLIASHHLERYRDPERFDTWPHAVGHLQVNPIYTVTPAKEADAYDLTFRFPSDWYAFENERYQTYATPTFRLSARDIRALASGERSARTDELIERFVALGMPETYVHSRQSHTATVWAGTHTQTA